jgi:hypothetical protein
MNHRTWSWGLRRLTYWGWDSRADAEEIKLLRMEALAQALPRTKVREEKPNFSLDLE